LHKSLNIFKKNKAVSTVVGVLFIVSIVVLSVSAIFLWGIPYINQLNVNSEYETISNQMDNLKSVHDNLINQKLGSTEEKNIAIGTGSFQMTDSSQDRLAVIYGEDDFSVSKLTDGDKSFLLTSGTKYDITKVKAYWSGTKTSYSSAKPTNIANIELPGESGIYYDSNTYDFSDPNSEAYGTTSGNEVLPLDPGDASYVLYDTNKYNSIQIDDENYNSWDGDDGKYVNLFYKFKINENPEEITSLHFVWNGYDDLIYGGDLSFFIWDVISSEWEERYTHSTAESEPDDYDFYKIIAKDPDLGDKYIDSNGFAYLGISGSKGFTVPPSRGITVTYPTDSGLTFYKTYNYEIAWTSFNVDGNVKIELYKSDIFYDGIAASTDNDGKYLWTVDSEIDTDTDYKIRISSVSYTEVEDYSDNDFSIDDLPTDTVSDTCVATCSGATCEVTCSGSTCEGTCFGDTCGGATVCLGATCDASCSGTCSETCAPTCSDTCPETCVGTCSCDPTTNPNTGTCDPLATCAGGETCAGSYTCEGETCGVMETGGCDPSESVDQSTCSETCPSGCCCFPAGTLISLSDGGFKCIEDVVVGDGVLSFDVDENVFVSSYVTDLIIRVREGVYSINDGLVCPTNDHPFYVMKADGCFGWAAINPDVSKVMYGDRDAMALEVGDFLLSSDGSWVRINSIEFIPGIITTYTFTVDSVCHDYFANNVLVSNGGRCLTPTIGSCCFPAGTLISLSDGGFKCIEDVVVGDGVLSFDVEDENFVYSSVTNLIVKVREGVYSINDGLVCPTNDHPFYVMKADGRFGWAAISPDVSKVMYGDRDAMALEVGDFLLSSDGSWIKINSIEFMPGIITTYTFTVDSVCHDYYANNVLVSNDRSCGCYSILEKDTSAVLDDELLGIFDTRMFSFSNKIFSVIPDFDDSSSDSPLYISRAVSSLEGDEFEPEINFIGKTIKESIITNNIEDTKNLHYTLYENYVKLVVTHGENDNYAPITKIISDADTVDFDEEIIQGEKPIRFKWEGSDDQTDSEDLVYKYRLDPYQSSWQPAQDTWTNITDTDQLYIDIPYELPRGDYKFRVRAMDKAKNIETTERTDYNDPINGANVLSFSIVEPSQTLDHSTNPDIFILDKGIITKTVELQDKIEGFVHIELYTYNEEDLEDELIGDIYVFDTSPIKWADTTSSSENSIYIQNGAIFKSTSNNDPIMTQEPNIYVEGDTLVFHIVMTSTSLDSSGAGGSGDFKLVSRLVENRVLYDGSIDDYIFRVQNSGDLSTDWNEFFVDSIGFKTMGLSTLNYPYTDNLNLVLMLSIIEIDI